MRTEQECLTAISQIEQYKEQIRNSINAKGLSSLGYIDSSVSLDDYDNFLRSSGDIELEWIGNGEMDLSRFNDASTGTRPTCWPLIYPQNISHVRFNIPNLNFTKNTKIELKMSCDTSYLDTEDNPVKNYLAGFNNNTTNSEIGFHWLLYEQVTRSVGANHNTDAPAWSDAYSYCDSLVRLHAQFKEESNSTGIIYPSKNIGKKYRVRNNKHKGADTFISDYPVEITFDMYNNHVQINDRIWGDSTSYVFKSFGSHIDNNEVDFGIFGEWSYGASGQTTMPSYKGQKFYHFRKYESGVLKMNIIPVLHVNEQSDIVACLKDTISGVYYYPYSAFPIKWPPTDELSERVRTLYNHMTLNYEFKES